MSQKQLTDAQTEQQDAIDNEIRHFLLTLFRMAHEFAALRHGLDDTEFDLWDSERVGDARDAVLTQMSDLIDPDRFYPNIIED